MIWFTHPILSSQAVDMNGRNLNENMRYPFTMGIYEFIIVGLHFDLIWLGKPFVLQIGVTPYATRSVVLATAIDDDALNAEWVSGSVHIARNWVEWFAALNAERCCGWKLEFLRNTLVVDN